ncbi:unnamed protein product [Clonostachys byssicola]|uniref:Uncharacterized protein n=1 Tax=Clonostachys byssicola TaxID=160290 RepID=A0A9N9XUI9_9HYPO|nr:unnamed protein product [Clonostachys byssicola]
MGLVGQHQLRKHVLVAGDCDGVLMLHDRPAVNVKGRNQNIFHMVLGGPTGVFFREVPASDRNGAESDECWEDGFAGEDELSFWLSSDVRSDSWIGGCGDFGGRDICEGEREGGNEDSEVRRVVEGGAPEPLEPLS